jgi:hypothetical protein
VRRGGLQQQQQRSSTWASFTLPRHGSKLASRRSNTPSSAPPIHPHNKPIDSLLGKRSQPVDDRDPGPTPKRQRRESPPSGQDAPTRWNVQPSSIQHSVCPLLIFSLLLFSSHDSPLHLACSSHVQHMLTIPVILLISHFYPPFSMSHFIF